MPGAMLMPLHLLVMFLRQQLEAAEAKWQLQYQQDNPGTVIENVSVGWLNLVLQVSRSVL